MWFLQNTADLSHGASGPNDQRGLRHWQTNPALKVQGRYTPQFSERQTHRPVQGTNYSLKGEMNLENSYPLEHQENTVLTLTESLNPSSKQGTISGALIRSPNPRQREPALKNSSDEPEKENSPFH